MAVNAAVGKKAHQMKRRAVLLAVFNRSDKRLVCKEVTVTNGFCNSCKLLINNSARADVGVSNLAVAHLSVGKTNVHTRSADECVGIGCKELVNVRCACGNYCVSVVGSIFAEAVKNDKSQRFFHINMLLFD